MDIAIDAHVFCVDGECGRVRCVVLNPHSTEVTHIVVKEDGFLGQERLVPLDQVMESDPDRIHLRCTIPELHKMENFIDVQFIGGYESLDNYDMEEHYFHPYLLPDFEGEDEPPYAEIERIPPGESGIHRGAGVRAVDGKIGKVDVFVVSPMDYHISHLVLEEGHLWGRKTVTIPVSEIDKIEDDVVFLKLDKAAVGKLPAVPVRRRSS